MIRAVCVGRLEAPILDGEIQRCAMLAGSRNHPSEDYPSDQEIPMKAPCLHMLVACACITATAVASAEVAPSNDANDVAVIRQLSRDMGDAMVAVDVDKLEQMFADNWVTLGSGGKIVTKEGMLRDFKSGADKLETY